MAAVAHVRVHYLAWVVVGCLTIPAAVSAASEVPETVMITYQVKAGAEAALSRVIAKHWRVAQHMNLVRSSPPHVVLQGGDEGRRYIVEVLTWRDGSIPDNAPDAITELWQEMSQYVVAREGHSGIDFSPVNVLME
jgi:hypothetical protein